MMFPHRLLNKTASTAALKLIAFFEDYQQCLLGYCPHTFEVLVQMPAA
jgi:hypothetical protein